MLASQLLAASHAAHDCNLDTWGILQFVAHGLDTDIPIEVSAAEFLSGLREHLMQLDKHLEPIELELNAASQAIAEIGHIKAPNWHRAILQTGKIVLETLWRNADRDDFEAPCPCGSGKEYQQCCIEICIRHEHVNNGWKFAVAGYKVFGKIHDVDLLGIEAQLNKEVSLAAKNASISQSDIDTESPRLLKFPSNISNAEVGGLPDYYYQWHKKYHAQGEPTFHSPTKIRDMHQQETGKKLKSNTVYKAIKKVEAEHRNDE